MLEFEFRSGSLSIYRSTQLKDTLSCPARKKFLAIAISVIKGLLRKKMQRSVLGKAVKFCDLCLNNFRGVTFLHCGVNNKSWTPILKTEHVCHRGRAWSSTSVRLFSVQGHRVTVDTRTSVRTRCVWCAWHASSVLVSLISPGEGCMLLTMAPVLPLAARLGLWLSTESLSREWWSRIASEPVCGTQNQSKGP